MHRENPALQTDLYQVAMAAAYHAQGMNDEATFSLFARRLPKTRGFLVASGLEEVLDYLEDFRFTPQDIDYLKTLARFQPEFLDYLAGLRFTGQVRAMPEGSVFFGDEPIVEVTGPIIEGQLVETLILNTLNLNTMLTSKAARCVQAAQGRACVDFSLRRTQGLDAGLAVARSSAIAGFTGTSNVAAARELGLVPVGTMAHSFVEAFGDETAAFIAFADTFPGHCVLLVDTYESMTGLERAVQVAGRLAKKGHQLLGVRLDSGDLAEMSKAARELLDQAGLDKTRVVVSGSLDETSIAQLLARGGQVDTFGVGTKMGCSADAPYLDLAYKLVSYQGRPTLKLSSGKETWVEAKQIWRSLDSQGVIESDLMGLRGENQPGAALIETVMENGRRTSPRQDWQAARERYLSGLETLPSKCLELENPEPLTPAISPALSQLQEKTRRKALGEQD